MERHARVSQERNHRRQGLNPAEVEVVLRRAAELNAARGRTLLAASPEVPPEALLHLAKAAGIRGEDVRLALGELDPKGVAEAGSLSCRLYGRGRIRVVREVERPAGELLEMLEEMLGEEGLKVSYRSDAGSLWGPSDALGIVRRALDFSGKQPLLKAGSVELRVEELEGKWCRVSIISDISDQRSECLSLGGILGATLAILPAIGGFQDALYFIGVIPALALPGLGFRAAYHRTRVEVRRAMNRLLDRAQKVRPAEAAPDMPGDIPDLEPVSRFRAGRRKQER